MASEADRKAAVKEAEAAEKQRFDDWKKAQEDAGHTVTGARARAAPTPGRS